MVVSQYISREVFCLLRATGSEFSILFMVLVRVGIIFSLGIDSSWVHHFAEGYEASEFIDSGFASKIDSFLVSGDRVSHREMFESVLR